MQSNQFLTHTIHISIFHRGVTAEAIISNFFTANFQTSATSAVSQSLSSGISSVLLLNSSYEPLKVISWQKAVTLFFTGKVEVVSEYTHPIRSVSIVVQAPSVVRLLRYARIGRRTPPLSRTNVLARDNFQCQYCLKHMNAKEATMDHVIPRSQGGKTTWNNIVAACGYCNRKKGGDTPDEAKMKLLKKPVQPDWLPVINMRFQGQVPTAWVDYLFGE